MVLDGSQSESFSEILAALFEVADRTPKHGIGIAFATFRPDRGEPGLSKEVAYLCRGQCHCLCGFVGGGRGSFESMDQSARDLEEASYSHGSRRCRFSATLTALKKFLAIRQKWDPEEMFVGYCGFSGLATSSASS